MICNALLTLILCSVALIILGAFAAVMIVKYRREAYMRCAELHLYSG